ncbi:MAG: ribosomal RNA small subunit methyltransferase A [Bacilli bacterium]|nr:ribosomal RNA small subunit methyltransferase A [Bacilli bacterium]
MDNIVAKKSLGQNFLQDHNILRKISDSIDVTKSDLIIEIGPGKGALTNYLVEKGCQVIAFEIDERMREILDSFHYDNFKVYYGDFLKANLIEILNNYNYDNLYVMANIPYYITTPIIEYIIDSKINVKEMVLLVQKEVADRFSAGPGSKLYGSISVYLQYYFDVKKLFNVSNKCFFPVPKVDSAVVKFTRDDNKIMIDTNKFFKFVNECFQFKRKTLRNNLKGYDWSIIYKILLDNGFGDNVRAEELSIDVFIELFNELK